MRVKNIFVKYIFILKLISRFGKADFLNGDDNLILASAPPTLFWPNLHWAKITTSEKAGFDDPFEL